MTTSGCTLSDNSARDEGGTIYNVGLYGTAIIGNSAISNTAPDNIFGSCSGGGNTFK